MRLTVGVEAYRSTASDMDSARSGTSTDWGDSVESERKILHSVSRVQPLYPYVNLKTIAVYYVTLHVLGHQCFPFRNQIKCFFGYFDPEIFF